MSERHASRFEIALELCDGQWCHRLDLPPDMFRWLTDFDFADRRGDCVMLNDAGRQALDNIRGHKKGILVLRPAA